MNKKIWLGSCLIAPFLIMALGLHETKIKVGYCPTMLPYVAELQSDGLVKLIAYDSSQEALQGLQNKKVDLVVIGRKAKNQEIITNVSFNQLDERATTLVKTISQNENETYLIPWRELDYGRVELVVVTDELGNKLAEHRTPFLYYLNHLDSRKVEKVSTLLQGKL